MISPGVLGALALLTAAMAAVGNGRFGFTRLLLRLTAETDVGDEAQARELAQKAEETCLVSRVARPAGRDRDPRDRRTRFV